jgi:hypothetical protein
MRKDCPGSTNMSRRKRLAFMMTVRMDANSQPLIKALPIHSTSPKRHLIRRSLRLSVQNARHQNWQSHMRQPEDFRRGDEEAQ